MLVTVSAGKNTFEVVVQWYGYSCCFIFWVQHGSTSVPLSKVEWE